jgi:hypothetical protein
MSEPATKDVIVQMMGCLIYIQSSLIFLRQIQKQPALPGIQTDTEKYLEEALAKSDAYLDEAMKLLERL